LEFFINFGENKTLNKQKEIKGIILAILASTLFGTHPSCVYFLRSNGMEILPTLLISSIQCFSIYLLILKATNKINSLRITKLQFKKLLLSASLFYSTIFFLFASYSKIPSGLATVIHFIYPSLVTILSVFTKRDKLSKPLIIAIFATFSGILLVSNPSNQSLNTIGILFAIFSAIVFSLYIYMINDKTFDKFNNTTFVFYISLFGTILLLIIILTKSLLVNSFTIMWGSYSNKVLFGAVALGITQAMGVLFLAKAIKSIGGPIGGALTAFEPLTAVIIGTIFFSEKMPFYCILGCLLILGSIIYLSIFKLKEDSNIIKKPCKNINY